MPNERSAEEIVRAKWPDARLMKAFAIQRDGTRKWMWCAGSSMAFLSRRGKKNRVTNIGDWMLSERSAWQSAAARIKASESERNGC